MADVGARPLARKKRHCIGFADGVAIDELIGAPSMVERGAQRLPLPSGTHGRGRENPAHPREAQPPERLAR